VLRNECNANAGEVIELDRAVRIGIGWNEGIEGITVVEEALILRVLKAGISKIYIGRRVRAHKG